MCLWLPVFIYRNTFTSLCLHSSALFSIFFDLQCGLACTHAQIPGKCHTFFNFKFNDKRKILWQHRISFTVVNIHGEIQWIRSLEWQPYQRIVCYVSESSKWWECTLNKQCKAFKTHFVHGDRIRGCGK